MFVTQDTSELAARIQSGAVVAYPTEAVFGLGCDPRNLTAVRKLLALKQRPSDKGLILIAADFAQIRPFLASDISPSDAQTQPDNITWVFPANPATSPLLRGRYTSLAVRITKHPLVRALCSELNGPLVSTSANLTGEPPCYSAQAVIEHFQHHPFAPDAVLDGPTGGQLNPTEIRDAISGTILRHS
ncbi:MAG: hypothetical protein CSB47_06150 [Proteobacteria bacterium]|nr:MAG: hypothetical protein CSB47_06150 [Pseudomonadota bacterium]